MDMRNWYDGNTSIYFFVSSLNFIRFKVELLYCTYQVFSILFYVKAVL